LKNINGTQLICKSFNTKSADATISIPGRLRLFGFHSVGNSANPILLHLKNKNRNGEVIARLTNEYEGVWGAFKCVYNFGPNGILFSDGLFLDTNNSGGTYFISNSSFFYEGA
jgi:hypothetical protein